MAPQRSCLPRTSNSPDFTAPSRLSTPFPSRLLPRPGLGKAYVHEMYMHTIVTNGGRVACMRLRARPRRLLQPSSVAPRAAPTSARARVCPPRLCSHRPQEASLPCFTDASPRPPGLLPALGWVVRDGDGAPPPPHGQDRMYQPMMGYAWLSPPTCSMYQPPPPFLFPTIHHQASPYLFLSLALSERCLPSFCFPISYPPFLSSSERSITADLPHWSPLPWNQARCPPLLAPWEAKVWGRVVRSVIARSSGTTSRAVEAGTWYQFREEWDEPQGLAVPGRCAQQLLAPLYHLLPRSPSES